MGALKPAKSRRQGECLTGAVAQFGGTGIEQREAIKPRSRSRVTTEGSAGDVAALRLALDIGDISDMDNDMDKRILQQLPVFNIL